VDGVDTLGVKKNALGKGRLARIDVSADTYISQFRQIAYHGCTMPALRTRGVIPQRELGSVEFARELVWEGEPRQGNQSGRVEGPLAYRRRGYRQSRGRAVKTQRICENPT
jgi:hypothetical protein